jgi:hypothetical protein
VKILFDHCVTKPFRKALPNHYIKTTREMGWEGLKNGLLLAQAQEAGFEVLLTVDQNLRYQQNLSGRAIAVVVLIAAGITVEDLLPLVPTLENTLAQIESGHIYEVR